MRFNIAALAMALLAGSSIAAPVAPSSTIEDRSLVTELGQFINDLEVLSGLRFTEEQINKLLGGKLKELEDALGTTFLEKTLNTIDEATAGTAEPGFIQAVGVALSKLAEGLGLDEVNEWLDQATLGFYTDIEDVLGITDIKQALGLTEVDLVETPVDNKIRFKPY